MKNKYKFIKIKYKKYKTSYSKKDSVIAILAKKAFENAKQKALSYKLPIIQREGNKIVKIYPNQKKEILKHIKNFHIEKKEFFLPPK